MTDSDTSSRLRHGADNIHSIGPVLASNLLRIAASELDTCKAAAERALGVTANTAEEAVELLATEHLNLQRRLADRARVAAEDAALGVGNRAHDGVHIREARLLLQGDGRAPLSSLLDGPDPAPVDLDAYKERVRSHFGAAPATNVPFTIQRPTMASALADAGVTDLSAVTQAQGAAAIAALSHHEKPAPGTIEIVGGDGETIRALGLPEACTHAKTMPGPNIPLRHGSWCSEVCRGCGKWRFVGHNGAQVGSGAWRSDSLDEAAKPREEDT